MVIPEVSGWKELEMYLGMNQSQAEDRGFRCVDEGRKLAGNADLWDDGDLEYIVGFGKSGFNALPGGERPSDVGFRTWFWTAPATDDGKPWCRVLSAFSSDISRVSVASKYQGFSIRCVKD